MSLKEIIREMAGQQINKPEIIIAPRKILPVISALVKNEINVD